MNMVDTAETSTPGFLSEKDSEGRGAALTVRAVRAHVVRAAVDPPWRISTATYPELFATLVEVELENGIVGWGECIVRQAPSATKAIVDELLAPLIVQQDAWNVEALWERMCRPMRLRGHTRGFHLEAVAGVDIALWDALGKSLDQPIWRLLHGEGRRSVSCYASSILLQEPASAAAEASNLVEAGWTAIKLKVGRDVATDTRAVWEVRRAIGDDVELMLDANGFYDATGAVKFARGIEEAQVAWLEEPVPADDVDGYRKLSRSCPTVPLAAGEAEFTTAGFLPFSDGRLLDVWQPDVARAGGFTGMRKIAALAQAHNVMIAPHVGASAAVCMAASLQFSAAVHNFRIYEHMFIYQPLQELFTAPLPEPSGGFIGVPQGPGLGCIIDEERVRSLALPL